MNICESGAVSAAAGVQGGPRPGEIGVGAELEAPHVAAAGAFGLSAG